MKCFHYFLKLKWLWLKSNHILFLWQFEDIFEKFQLYIHHYFKFQILWICISFHEKNLELYPCCKNNNHLYIHKQKVNRSTLCIFQNPSKSFHHLQIHNLPIFLILQSINQIDRSSLHSTQNFPMGFLFKQFYILILNCFELRHISKEYTCGPRLNQAHYLL